MAAKRRWNSYILYAVSIMLSLGLGAALIALRETCMNTQTNDFHFTKRCVP